MAVLPTPSSCSSSPKHSLFLRLFFLMMVVIAFPAWEKAAADPSPSTQTLEDFDDDNTTISEGGVSTGIPLTLIQPTGTTIGISQTTVSPEVEGSEDQNSVVVSEEHIPFSIEPSLFSTTSLERETETPYTEALTSKDKAVVYQTHGTTEQFTPPEEKIIRAPVVRFKMSKRKDRKTGYVKEVIELEENRLQLDEYGKRAVLIDASVLPESYQSSAILQLSLRYRRHCGVERSEWDSMFEAAKDSIDSVASHMVYQESSVKPFSSSRNLYLLQVDLCQERKEQVFSLYFTKEKNIRSMVSKFGSVASYIIAAKIAGQFVTERQDSQGKPYRIADGDNGSFADTLAAALPAGAIFNGVAYAREEIERWNLSGYDSDISACVTAGLMAAAMNILDPNFTSDTSHMFVSNAGRLYSRSAFFGELYSCTKTSFVDRMVYGWTGSHNATDAESEAISSVTTSVMAAVFMYSYDFIDSAEMELMQRQEIKDNKGLNKLERTQLGNIARGGAASTPYKIVDTVDQHLLPGLNTGNELELKPDDSWNYYLAQVTFQALFWMVATTTLHYTRPYEAKNTPTLAQQLLNTNSIFAANIMEAITAHGFGLLDKHVSKPVSGYLADRAVSLNLTVPDSWMHKGIKTSVRFTINFGTAYVGVNAINYAGNKAKNSWYSMDNPDEMPSLARKYYESNRFFIDVVTGTATNGVVLPLVLSLDEDLFTPISDGASYFLCSPRGWGIGCPTKELQIGVVVDKSGMLVADTHELQLVTSD